MPCTGEEGALGAERGGVLRRSEPGGGSSGQRPTLALPPPPPAHRPPLPCSLCPSLASVSNKTYLLTHRSPRIRFPKYSPWRLSDPDESVDRRTAIALELLQAHDAATAVGGRMLASRSPPTAVGAVVIGVAASSNREEAALSAISALQVRLITNSL